MDKKLAEYVDSRGDMVELYKRINDDGYEEIYAKINIRNECTHDYTLANAIDYGHKQFQKEKENEIIIGLVTHKTILFDYEKDKIIFRKFRMDGVKRNPSY